MKREELIAMGISEENVEKIIADYGSAVQREQAKAAELKAKADSADELQKKLDEMEAGNLTELEKANKALETANQQIADMQKKNAIRDQREALMEKLKINAEQAKSVVKDNGSLDYDALGKITAEKETAAAQAKEQEIANNSENNIYSVIRISDRLTQNEDFSFGIEPSSSGGRKIVDLILSLN